LSRKSSEVVEEFGSNRFTQLTPELKKFCELLDGEPGLSDNRAKGTWLQISPRMERDSHGPSRAPRTYQNMVTADDRTRLFSMLG
jgi:hypothetical protein